MTYEVLVRYLKVNGRMGSSSFCRKTNIYIAKCLLFLILQPVSKMPLSHWDSQKGPISKIPKDLWVDSPVNYRTFSVLKRVYELKHFLFHSTSTYLFKGVPIHCPVRILNIFFFFLRARRSLVCSLICLKKRVKGIAQYISRTPEFQVQKGL